MARTLETIMRRAADTGISPDRASALKTESKFYYSELCKENHRAFVLGEINKSVYYTKSACCVICARNSSRERLRRKNRIKYSPAY